MALATSDVYHGPASTGYQTGIKSKLAGTDKWNSLIEKVSAETGVNALMIKVIMSMESSGTFQNTPNSYGYAGLMQTNYQACLKEYGQAFLNDPYTQILAGARELAQKEQYIKGVISRGNGKGSAQELSWPLFYTAHGYNGYSWEGHKYAVQFKIVYEGMGGSITDPVISGTPINGGGTGTYTGDPGTGGSGSGIGADVLLNGTPGWQGGGTTGIGGDKPATSHKYTDYDVNDPLSSMFIGTSPNVEDDDYPAHRFASNPFVLRIGDSQFFIPPTSIKTSKVTMVDSRHTIRAKNPMMTKSGFTTQKLDLRLYFCGDKQINGFPVSAPNSGTYYMDGLRALLAQFMKNPFLPIRNELVNDRHNIMNVALHNISITTDSDFPNQLVVDLTLLECTMMPFTGFADYIYDRLFVYPMFRWWYQQMLNPDESKRYTNTYLKPVPNFMNGQAYFKVLDRDLIEQMQRDVYEANKGKKDKFGNTIDPNYALSKMKMPDIRSLMTDWPINGAILRNVVVNIGKQLTPLNIDDFEKPVFQDLGGTEKEFVLEYHCTNQSQLESFQALVSHLEEMSRDFRFRFVSGYMAIDNEIVNLAGIYHAMVLGLDTETIDGFPGEYIVRLYCKSFDATQKDQERVDGYNYNKIDEVAKYDKLEKFTTKMDRKSEIAYEWAFNTILDGLELYPDLELPTFATANEAVAAINAYRQGRGQSKLPYDKLKQPPGAIWVDPDFYIAYPTMKDAYKDLELGDMGEKVTNLLLNGTYDEFKNLDLGDPTMMQDLDSALAKAMGALQDNTWDADEDGKRKVLKSQAVKYNGRVQDYLVPAGEAWSLEDNPLPDDKTLVEMMTVNMTRYNQRYRLNRAFPSYVMVLVDEGQWIDGRKLFNNYYTYHAINQLDVVKDKDNAVDLAFISISNIYGTFDFQSRFSDPRTYKKPVSFKDRWKTLRENFWFTVNEKVISERMELMEHIKIREGARIHIRLGYSATASNHPIVFNGVVASANEGEEISLVCQGDGAELINQFYSTDPKSGTPNEPHNTFQEILTKRTSNYWFTVSANFEFGGNYLSAYGIEHFGFVESIAENGFWSGLFSEHWAIVKSGLADIPPMQAYDVMKNIYKGSRSPVTGVDTGWNPFDGEKNININGYNKTPWDIGQILANFVPEFICAVHPHGFRSTLFFGMPHWLVKCGYELKEGKEGSHFKDYNERVQPYQQFHVLTTGNDIIRNNIKASSEHIKHVAVGIYQLGDGQKASESYTVYADKTILKDRQKMMIVDTGVWQDLFGPDFLYNFIGKMMIKPTVQLPLDVMGAIAEMMDALPDSVKGFEFKGKSLQDKIDEMKKAAETWTSQWRDQADAMFTPGQVQARTVAIGALQRKMMEMYQGELVIFGDPAIKPWDIFYINDTHLMMQGTVQVGKVSHSLSRATGFTSVIKPDLVTSRTDGFGARMPIINGLIFLGTTFGIAVTRKVLTSKFMLKLFEGSGKGVTKLGRKLTPNKVKGTRVAKWGSKITDFAKQKIPGALKLMKGNIFTFFLTGMATEWLTSWYEKNTKYNNMIYIYPIWKMGEPFVAGITGGANIIPGYMDPRFADPFMTGKFTEPKPVPVENESSPSVGGSTTSPSTEATILPGSGKVRHPLSQKTKVTSGYGPRWGTIHAGTDLAPIGYDANGNPVETKVYAIADGTISAMGPNASMGNYISYQINVDGKPYLITFMHLKSFAGGISSGSQIKAGQELGVMGTTGDSTGVHLHIEVANGTTRQLGGYGNRTDPQVWFQKQGVTL